VGARFTSGGTGADNLYRIARQRGLPTSNVAPILRRLDLADHAGSRMRDSPPGVVRRLRIAAALLSMPDLVVLDDAFDELQPAERGPVTALVADLAGAGCAVVLTSRRISDAVSIADRVIVLVDGRVALDCHACEFAVTIDGMRAYPDRERDVAKVVEVGHELRARVAVHPDKSVSIGGVLTCAGELVDRLAAREVVLRALLPELP
jgi:ABC-2 type transport system ATP-binding protein